MPEQVARKELGRNAGKQSWKKFGKNWPTGLRQGSRKTSARKPPGIKFPEEKTSTTSFEQVPACIRALNVSLTRLNALPVLERAGARLPCGTAQSQRQWHTQLSSTAGLGQHLRTGLSPVGGLSSHGVYGLCAKSLAHGLPGGHAGPGHQAAADATVGLLLWEVGHMPVIRTPRVAFSLVSSVDPTSSTA